MVADYNRFSQVWIIFPSTMAEFPTELFSLPLVLHKHIPKSRNQGISCDYFEQNIFSQEIQIMTQKDNFSKMDLALSYSMSKIFCVSLHWGDNEIGGTQVSSVVTGNSIYVGEGEREKLIIFLSIFFFFLKYIILFYCLLYRA